MEISRPPFAGSRTGKCGIMVKEGKQKGCNESERASRKREGSEGGKVSLWVKEHDGKVNVAR